MRLVDEAVAALVKGEAPPECFIPFNVSSNAPANSIVASSGECYLFGFTVLSTNAAAQFVQVFDAASLPADGAVPDLVIVVSAAGDRELGWIPPRRMDQGIVICNSSTAATKTLGSADCFFDVQYV